MEGSVAMHERGPIDQLTEGLAADYCTVSFGSTARDGRIQMSPHRMTAGAEIHLLSQWLTALVSSLICCSRPHLSVCVPDTHTSPFSLPPPSFPFVHLPIQLLSPRRVGSPLSIPSPLSSIFISTLSHLAQPSTCSYQACWQSSPATAECRAVCVRACVRARLVGVGQEGWVAGWQWMAGWLAVGCWVAGSGWFGGWLVAGWWPLQKGAWLAQSSGVVRGA